MARKVKTNCLSQIGRSPNVMVGDGLALPFASRSFDVAFLIAVLGEVRNKQQTFVELRRVLKLGGTLSIIELLADPDYLPKQTVLTLGQQSKFVLEYIEDIFLGYTVNFT